VFGQQLIISMLANARDNAFLRL